MFSASLCTTVVLCFLVLNGFDALWEDTPAPTQVRTAPQADIKHKLKRAHEQRFPTLT
jgi:hypothetical protein